MSDRPNIVERDVPDDDGDVTLRAVVPDAWSPIPSDDVAAAVQELGARRDAFRPAEVLALRHTLARVTDERDAAVRALRRILGMPALGGVGATDAATTDLAKALGFQW